MDNWINVNDRLPNFREKVLCYYIGLQPKMSGPQIGILHRDPRVQSYKEKSGFSLASDVLYWQPLPPPPKQKSV